MNRRQFINTILKIAGIAGLARMGLLNEARAEGLVIGWPAAGGSVVLGINSTTDTFDTAFSGAGEIRLFRTQASGSGSVSTFHFNQYGNANWLGVIYSDNAGEPDALLASTASNAGGGFSWAWDTADLDASESITSGSYYWVGVQVATNTDFFYKAKQAGTAKSYTTTFGSPPSSWPTGSDSDLGGASAGGVMYAD